MNSTEFNSSASVRPKELSGIHEETVPNNTRWEEGVNKTLPNLQVVDHQQGSHHRHILKLLPPMEATGGEKSSTPIKGIKRGHPRQNPHKHFDINEHLPWMIVLFLLLVLVVIVVCSIRKSSRTLKKGPRQDPSAIVEKAGLKKSIAPAQTREKWIYYCNGHGELFSSPCLSFPRPCCLEEWGMQRFWNVFCTPRAIWSRCVVRNEVVSIWCTVFRENSHSALFSPGTFKGACCKMRAVRGTFRDLVQPCQLNMGGDWVQSGLAASLTQAGCLFRTDGTDSTSPA